MVWWLIWLTHLFYYVINCFIVELDNLKLKYQRTIIHAFHLQYDFISWGRIYILLAPTPWKITCSTHWSLTLICSSDSHASFTCTCWVIPIFLSDNVFVGQEVEEIYLITNDLEKFGHKLCFQSCGNQHSFFSKRPGSGCTTKFNHKPSGTKTWTTTGT